MGQGPRPLRDCPSLTTAVLLNSTDTIDARGDPAAPKAVAERAEVSRTPVADRIRRRLEAAGQRYFANDNISAFLEAGEVEELKAEVEARMREVLQALVIDIESDHNTQDTARRVAKMFLTEVFGGRYEPAPPVTEFPNVSRLNELMIVGPVTVRSACSTHLGRRHAERALCADRPFQVRAAHRMGHESAADSGRSHRTAGDAAAGKDAAGRPCHRHGG